MSDFAFDQPLRREIAGHLAQFAVRRVDANDRLRHAAVGIVLLSDTRGQTCLVLTRRLSTLRRHAGQWALPGGRLEPGETPQHAALREIREEINLSFDAANVLGCLDDFATRSGHLITPFVLWSGCDANAVRLSPDEVDAVFIVPLAELDAADAVDFHPLLHCRLPSLPTTVHAPTAAILYQFREVALHGREVRVADVEQPFFSWR